MANVPHRTRERTVEGNTLKRRSRRKQKREEVKERRKKNEHPRYTHARHLYHLRCTMVNMSIMLAQWIYVLMWNNKFVMWLRVWGCSRGYNRTESADWTSWERGRGRDRESGVGGRGESSAKWEIEDVEIVHKTEAKIEREKCICGTMHAYGGANSPKETHPHTHTHPKSWLLLLIYVVHTRITPTTPATRFPHTHTAIPLPRHRQTGFHRNVYIVQHCSGVASIACFGARARVPFDLNWV